MSLPRYFVSLGLTAPVTTFVLIALTAPASRADQIILRGGGQVRGKVIADDSRPDRITVLTEKGKTPLVFDKPKVVQIVREASPLDDYVAKRSKTAQTADSQYDLGLWCAEHKLPDLAEIHYEAAIGIDNAFGPAHQKLGHILYGERWLTHDELRAAQGLVRYKGKWITKEEKEQRDEQAATTAEQNSWKRRVFLLRQAMASGSEFRRREAETQLLEIRDPIAVKPLALVLGDDTNEFRTLLDRVLGEIPGHESAGALVNRVLFEADADVRQLTLEQVLHREELEVLPLLLKALRATNPVLVNRAAWTIAHLGTASAVPKLIPALYTTQYRVVWVGGGGSSGGLNMSFGSIAPTPGVPLTPVAYNGSSVGYLTPPAIGPGAIAYGATSAPAYASTGISTGGCASGSRGPVPRLVPFTYQNVEVLAALNTLTGQDFGYNIDAWKQWLRTSFRADPAPARRVPQP